MNKAITILTIIFIWLDVIFTAMFIKKFGIEIEVNVLFRTKPSLDFKSYIQALKGRTARYLRKEFPELLKDELWGEHFWSPSYF